MSKRRNDSDIDVSSTDESGNESDSGDHNEEEIVNVDFDYFDLDGNVDFHATKNFLRQLFGDDANDIDVSGLADLILKENSIGTTIKTDGKESDPFAMLSVVNVTENLEKPAIKKVVSYLLEKTKPTSEVNLILRKLLAPRKAADTRALKTGWIFSERLINMPVETVPPMYKMLLEEMEKAENSHTNFDFDYFLVVSRVYKMVRANVEDPEADSKQAKKRKNASEPVEEFDYFHYEDMVLEEHSKYHAHYPYTNSNQDTDSRRVFFEYGIDPHLSVILLDKKAMANIVPEMELKFPPF